MICILYLSITFFYVICFIHYNSGSTLVCWLDYFVGVIFQSDYSFHHCLSEISLEVFPWAFFCSISNMLRICYFMLLKMDPDLRDVWSVLQCSNVLLLSSVLLLDTGERISIWKWYFSLSFLSSSKKSCNILLDVLFMVLI